MISRAPDVVTYIAELPAERQGPLRKLRTLCRKSLPGSRECMMYGMPAYTRDGQLQVAFASQKQYVALYVGREELVREFSAEIPGAKCGKGCIRFSKPAEIDFAAVARLLDRNARSKEAPC
jgi:uncharacterized protein YdhG (YjbR/CyaY superfamily)